MSNPIDRKIPESIALGKMVHEARQKLGVLQRYVGDHANCSGSTVMRIEKGVVVNPDMVQRVCAVLNVRISDPTLGAYQALYGLPHKTKHLPPATRPNLFTGSGSLQAAEQKQYKIEMAFSQMTPERQIESLFRRAEDLRPGVIIKAGTP